MNRQLECKAAVISAAMELAQYSIDGIAWDTLGVAKYHALHKEFGPAMMHDAKAGSVEAFGELIGHAEGAILDYQHEHLSECA